MRQPHEPMEGTAFPRDLEPLWGRSVRARANVAYRTVIEIPDKKTGKGIKMPLLETTDLKIEGYDKVIPTAIVMSPAFWRSKPKMMDTVEFSGTLIKEQSRFVGFCMIHKVKVLPFQSKLYSTNESEETLLGKEF